MFDQTHWLQNFWGQSGMVWILPKALLPARYVTWTKPIGQHLMKSKLTRRPKDYEVVSKV